MPSEFETNVDNSTNRLWLDHACIGTCGFFLAYRRSRRPAGSTPFWERSPTAYARGLRHSALRAGSWSSLGTSRQLLKINSAKLRNTTPPAKSSATSQPEEVRLGSKAWCHSSRIAVINVMLTASSVHRVRMERNALGRDEVS